MKKGAEEGNSPLTQFWSFLARGGGVGGPPAVAGGPGGKNWGIKVVRAKVRAWKSEKMA